MQLAIYGITHTIGKKQEARGPLPSQQRWEIDLNDGIAEDYVHIANGLEGHKPES
jgi:hypothetical protein